MDPEFVEELDGVFSTNERLFYMGQIYDMVNDYHAGDQPRLQDYEWWQWELYRYWIELERYFERVVQVKLGALVDSFSKKK